MSQSIINAVKEKTSQKYFVSDTWVYIYIYTNNASTGSFVYFDDLKIIHQPVRPATALA